MPGYPARAVLGKRSRRAKKNRSGLYLAKEAWSLFFGEITYLESKAV
jgi:hypothetical protein